LDALVLLEGHQEPAVEALRHDQAFVLMQAAWASGLLGQLNQADTYARQGFAICEHLGMRIGLWLAHRIFGEIARTRGDLRAALHHFREAIVGMHRQGTEAIETLLLIQIAMVSQAAGEWTCAAHLLGFTEAYWTRNRFAASTRSFATWEDNSEPSRRALGKSRFAFEFETGQRLTRAEAYAEAISLMLAHQIQKAQQSLLTRRETEVLAHLAQGKTNQEIAADLFVGKSTVDTHVAHILAKLGVESRRAAVEAARERGLLPASGSAH
jgi:non-specific serine/threonine protein kinase